MTGDGALYPLPPPPLLRGLLPIKLSVEEVRLTLLGLRRWGLRSTEVDLCLEIVRASLLVKLRRLELKLGLLVPFRRVDGLRGGTPPLCSRDDVDEPDVPRRIDVIG